MGCGEALPCREEDREEGLPCRALRRYRRRQLGTFPLVRKWSRLVGESCTRLTRVSDGSASAVSTGARSPARRVVDPFEVDPSTDWAEHVDDPAYGMDPAYGTGKGGDAMHGELKEAPADAVAMGVVALRVTWGRSGAGVVGAGVAGAAVDLQSPERSHVDPEGHVLGVMRKSGWEWGRDSGFTVKG